MIEAKFSQINKQQKAQIYPVNADSYSFVISNLTSDKIMFIASDEAKLAAIEEQIKFFSPNVNIIVFPSWDCAYYDKISPNIAVLTQRIAAMNQMLEAKKAILLTSAKAIIQKLPPKDLIPEFCKTIKKNDNIARDELLTLLIALSFRRVEVASEPGDFAVRGGIIDIVSKPDLGYRIDFFGSKVEKIRSFDLVTQTSIIELAEIKLLPSSEVVLTPETIKCFEAKFIQEFGDLAADSPLYQAISSGRKYPGMEHYLPCFYNNLADIFDYFQPDQILYDHEIIHEFAEEFKQIKEYYQERKDLLVSRFKDELLYYPLEPEQLWLEFSDLEENLNKYKQIKSHQFSLDQTQGIDLEIKISENFDLSASNKNISAFDLFKKYRDECKKKIVVACMSEGSLQRISSILENYNIHCYRLSKFADYKNISGKTVGIAILPIEHGFNVADFAIVSEQDLLGEKIIRKKSKKTLENILEEISNLQIGEYVVHQKHGIGLFSGLETISAAGINHDCLKINYDGGDILYLPVENLDLISRYGSSDEQVRLDKLGGVAWQHRREKLKEKLKIIAADLIKTAAIRASREADKLSANAHIYEEFCARFHYVETDDQLNSIKDVEADLASGVPMDRLVCGDVGFGKTEVAMRAAFIASYPEHGHKKQVAIIVPTTLLARQHYQGFYKRFAGFNLRIAQISRLVSAKEIKAVKQGLKDGSVDIVIGTHALLAKDVEFKNLGLLVVDEEHRFGVTQKEKLKKLQENVHILTLSATPIPRTLQMSLTGVRDLSIIATPPIDRQVVKTYIMNYDSVVIREAIVREFYRGGQIFFVCPRISDIEEILPKLKELVPEIKIVVAHGQMSPANLEEIMADFYSKKFHLLLSTTIIESGIDIPEANTIFIHRADKLGLAALYQLRGRVGRSNIKAFAYLLLPTHRLSKLAVSRLEVMQTLDTLGAGFTVASHDMDIRGFGNLVGDEQSGHIKEVGLELYQHMLNEAIMGIKENREKIDNEFSPQININLPIMLPDTYIADLNLRLNIYRHLAMLKTEDEVDAYAMEMIDRFGIYPQEVEYLLIVIKLKQKAKRVNVEKIDIGAKAITFSFRDNQCKEPDKLFELVEQNKLFIRIRPDHKLLISKEFKDSKEQLKFIDQLLNSLN